MRRNTATKKVDSPILAGNETLVELLIDGAVELDVFVPSLQAVHVERICLIHIVPSSGPCETVQFSLAEKCTYSTEPVVTSEFPLQSAVFFPRSMLLLFAAVSSSTFHFILVE